jgi:hypothetical protein
MDISKIIGNGRLASWKLFLERNGSFHPKVENENIKRKESWV